MNRFGLWLLLIFLALGAGFVLLLRSADDAPVVTTTSGDGSSSGAMRIPVAGVRPEQLTDSWNETRGGGARGHDAIDIMAPRGTPVVAATAGTVERIFESRLGGHTVYLRSADGGTVTYYAHLDSYAPGLAEGQAVAAGGPLGRVGSTGSASPDAPHLHFEVHRMAPGEAWHQGTATNPYPLLTGKLAR